MSYTGTTPWTIAAGCTGVASFTAFAPIAGGVTGTGSLQSLSSGMTNTGYVLTSTGASSLPTFQAPQLVPYTITTISNAASPYTVLSTDQIIMANCSAGAITVRLPNSTTTGRSMYIKDSTGSCATNNISITTVGGSVTIDGATTLTMFIGYSTICVIFDGSAYKVI